MEDKTPPTTNASPPAARTAESLRELRERAQSAMTAQRERMGSLETQLTDQLDSIASALSEQIDTDSDQSQQAEQSIAEANRLRQEVAEAQAAWQAEREQADKDIADRQQQLDQQQAELDTRAEQLSAGGGELDGRQQALDERAAQLNAQERELHTRNDELAKQEQEAANRQQEIEHSREELSSHEQSWKAEQEALTGERDALAQQVAQLTNDNESSEGQLKSELADVRRQLEEQQSAWDGQRTELEGAKSALETERDDLAGKVTQSNEELQAAQGQLGEVSGSQQELQQKFDLALEDVQRLRLRISELEQELIARPEPDQSDSVELVHLRAERDALAEQVAELEQQPMATADGDVPEEVADLQRRFELAVEDVRDLKKKNTQLEEQLDEAQAAGTSGASTPASEGSWESLKKQMLADLEGEGDGGSEERREEQAKIENTIRITDDVVGNKDREIAELQSQLAEGGGASEPAGEDEAIREIVDADAVVQQHRERIAKLEEETEAKLREAELELSVERAKIAREQTQLDDLRAEIKSMGPASDAGSSDAGQAPKRRWLSKLGLSGEEEKE